MAAQTENIKKDFDITVDYVDLNGADLAFTLDSDNLGDLQINITADSTTILDAMEFDDILHYVNTRNRADNGPDEAPPPETCVPVATLKNIIESLHSSDSFTAEWIEEELEKEGISL